MRKNADVINIVTNSASEQDVTINPESYRAGLSTHYLQYKDSLNMISGDNINLAQELKIAVNKYKHIRLSKNNPIQVDTTFTVNEGTQLNREHIDFIKDADRLIYSLSENKVDLFPMTHLLTSMEEDPALLNKLLQKSEQLKHIPVQQHENYSNSVHVVADTLSTSDIPRLTSLLDLSEVCHALTYACAEHKVILLLGSYGILYHYPFYYNASSLPSFIADIRSSIASKVSYGFINISRINLYFKSQVGTNAAIFYINNRPLITSIVTVSAFAAISILTNQVNAAPISSEVFTEVADTLVQKSTLFEKYPLTQLESFDKVYKPTLETTKGIAARCGNYISSLIRAFQDGVFYDYRDYFEYVDKNKEEVVEVLKKEKK